MEDGPGLPVRILRNLDTATLGQVALIVALSMAVVIVVERVGPWLLRHAGAPVERIVLPFLPLVRLVVSVVAIGTVVPLVVEPTVQNMVAIMGAVAVALGFALKDYLSSLIAGMVAMFERPYRHNDWITFEGAYGIVRDIGFRAVQLRTLDDTVVTVPHNRLWENSVRNANDAARTLQCIADFYLVPDHDGARVRDRLRDVALTSPYLALDRPIEVVVQERPWGTHYRLKAYPVAAAEQVRFLSDLTIRGKAELLAMGCRFATAGMVGDAEGPGVSGGAQTS